MKPRLLIDPKLLNDSLIELGRDFSHKLFKVLRLKPGESVKLVDGLGSEYETEIKSISSIKTLVKVMGKSKTPKPKSEITLVQAIAKGDRFDFVLKKAAEIGVSKIIPILTSRTVTKVHKNKVDNKLRRWQEILRHAIEQSGQTWMPKLESPCTFVECLRRSADNDLKLFFYEEEKERKIRDIWPKIPPSSTVVLIGPEGGFEPTEARLANESGFISLSLGNTVFRTDTAPLVVLTLIQFLLGEIG